MAITIEFNRSSQLFYLVKFINVKNIFSLIQQLIQFINMIYMLLFIFYQLCRRNDWLESIVRIRECFEIYFLFLPEESLINQGGDVRIMRRTFGFGILVLRNLFFLSFFGHFHLYRRIPGPIFIFKRLILIIINYRIARNSIHFEFYRI